MSEHNWAEDVRTLTERIAALEADLARLQRRAALVPEPFPWEAGNEDEPGTEIRAWDEGVRAMRVTPAGDVCRWYVWGPCRAEPIASGTASSLDLARAACEAEARRLGVLEGE